MPNLYSVNLWLLYEIFLLDLVCEKRIPIDRGLGFLILIIGIYLQPYLKNNLKRNEDLVFV